MIEYEKIILNNLDNMNADELKAIIKPYFELVTGYNRATKSKLIDIIKKIPLVYVFSDENVLKIIQKYENYSKKIDEKKKTKFEEIKKQFYPKMSYKDIIKKFKKYNIRDELKNPKTKATYTQRFRKLKDKVSESYSIIENIVKDFYLSIKTVGEVQKEDMRNYKRYMKVIDGFKQKLKNLNKKFLEDNEKYLKTLEKKKKKEEAMKGEKKEDKPKKKEKKIVKKSAKKTDIEMLKKLDKYRGDENNYNKVFVDDETGKKIYDSLGISEDEFNDNLGIVVPGEPPFFQLYSIFSSPKIKPVKIAVNNTGDALGIYNDVIKHIKSG